MVLNAGAFFGRLSSGFLARPVGAGNMLVGSMACCTVMVFAMAGLKTTGSVVAIAILYGYFAGICKLRSNHWFYAVEAVPSHLKSLLSLPRLWLH